MASENKRIVKNTLFLYGRMIFLTLINLYTVRITLDALGVEDYGIYNVIASFIALFSIISLTLTSATQRYLSFHLGQNNYHAYSKTFSLLLICFTTIAIIITIIAEIAGIFVFNGFLNIPEGKIYAAKWVYQTSIITFIIYLLTIPFTSSIVSNEKMSAFAYISIFDGIARLGLVYILLSVTQGRLILYGFLTLAEAILIFLGYVIYCKIKFKYCRISWYWDKGLFKELSSYTSWNLLGSMSATLASQGQSIMLNIFFGPAINTAKGIADKIYNVIHSLSSNFYMAVSPQIIKSYAANDRERMIELGINSSKLSFMLLFIASFPLICAITPLLVLWLGADGHTEDMAGFSRLVLLQGLVGCLEPPITHMIRATGNIKEYQIKVGACTILYIPIAWIALKIEGSPLLTMWVLIAIYSFVQIIRVKQAQKQVNLNISLYLKSVIQPICLLSVISFPLYVFILKIHSDNILSLCALQLGTGFISSIVLVFIIGLNYKEKRFLRNVIVQKLQIK